MRFIVDEDVPKTIHECDLIDVFNVKCRITGTDCDIWHHGECRQLISYPDYIREREKQCCAEMETHTHDT